jgi:formyltetrahydrofolate-dependent phosphoribosylglycinamide formyltransferase/phosphoribosylaminoimidazole-succinocarboxamide synthase
LIATGSVKDIYRWQNDSSVGPLLEFQFSDRYSVFDWGAMPQAISGKGECLGWIAALLFERCERAGISTHYQGVVNSEGQHFQHSGLLKGQLAGIVVQEVAIVPPVWDEVRGEWSYEQNSSESALQPRAKLIPLEVVFRHALTSGSSLLERRPEFRAGQVFDEPYIEFFTKLEPRDRFLTDEQARVLSGLSSEELAALRAQTARVAKLLQTWFAEVGLRLIDGKLEWAMTQDRRLILVDAIGPDELRLETASGVEISKEVFRRFFRGTSWFERVREVKREIDLQGRDDPHWQKRVTLRPPLLPRQLIDRFVESLRVLVHGLAEREIFPGTSPRIAEQALSQHDPLALQHGRVLLIGSGGREHALAWKILQSAQVSELVWFGNEATIPAIEALEREFPQKVIVRWNAAEFTREALASKAREADVNLAVIGPDQFLAEGWTNALEAQGVSVFGPTQEAARLEWSKSFAKEVMQAAQVPTAQAWQFSSFEDGDFILSSLDFSRPWVVKADGLALGKGVQICRTRHEAREFASFWLKQGQAVIVEEFLEGVESSWFAICDGKHCALLDPARDYKTLHEAGYGPNTGGMGAMSPLADLPRGFSDQVRSQVFEPVLQEMAKRGTPYSGVLYAGLMVSPQGFWVLEFNARFGDPEAQVLLPRVSGDLVPWLRASSLGRLGAFPTQVPSTDDVAVYVVAAAPGYPSAVEKGAEIAGLKGLERGAGFCAGVQVHQGKAVVSGGRVFGVLGRGRTFSEARVRAYSRLDTVRFEKMHYRMDIGLEPQDSTLKQPLVVLASGRGSNFVALAQACVHPLFPGKIVALFSNRSQAPALIRAQELGIRSASFSSEAEMAEAILAQAPRAVILAGYMKVLSREFLQRMRDAGISVLNIHPSLLPEFKGLQAYEQAWKAGRSETGVSVHEVIEALDAGPVLGQSRFSIADCQSLEEVEARGLAIEHELYPRVIARQLSRALTQRDCERAGEPEVAQQIKSPSADAFQEALTVPSDFKGKSS